MNPKSLFAAGAAVLLLGTLPALAADDLCGCCRVECVPAQRVMVEREVMCPPKTVERAVPICETVEVPVYDMVRIPRYRTVEVPVYETVEVPVYRTVEVPVYGECEVPVYTLVEKPLCILGLRIGTTCEKMVCGTRTEVRQVGCRTEQVACGTRTERVQVGTRTEEVPCGWETQRVQTGTRTQTVVVGCRTETVIVEPARFVTVRECVTVPPRCVTVTRSADPSHAVALPGTQEVMTETQFVQTTAGARR
jgi:hypothetical protein